MRHITLRGLVRQLEYGFRLNLHSVALYQAKREIIINLGG